MKLNEIIQNDKKRSEDIRYIYTLKIEEPPKKKYCIFKKYGIKYIDYKNPLFLSKFLNPQAKILPRRITVISLKYQKKLSKAIKRARHLALIPFVTDDLKKEYKKNENYSKKKY